MTDTTFRTQKEPDSQTEFKKMGDDSSQSIVNDIPVPHSDYKKTKGIPYTADYYQLGEYWETYNQEVGLLEGYFNDKIESGEIANETKTIEKEIKQMEKMLNLKDETRVSVKLGILAEHIKFLLGRKAVKDNAAKYGYKL